MLKFKIRLAIKLAAIIFSTLLLVTVIFEYKSLTDFPYENEQHYSKLQNADPVQSFSPIDHRIQDPVIIWWTPLTGERGKSKQCGPVKCFFTINRAYRNHSKTQAFIFYGTDFHIGDLPIPRLSNDEWGLFHEESPKNNFILSHQALLETFNHTSTFRRESNLPLTLQYLGGVSDLESKQYMVPTEVKTELVRNGTLALVNFIQSDCPVPSDRDHFVQMLMRHMKVDSYGECEHNTDLPLELRDPIKSMNHDGLYNIIAKYKFTITFENAVCNDYITEKLWRPLKVGSIPIVFGSPKIRELLPSPHSAIHVSDYNSIADLVSHLTHLHSNDAAYEKYLNFKHTGVQNNNILHLLNKREWGIHNDVEKPNMVETFECLICKRLHENIKRVKLGKHPIQHIATADHGGCPKPQIFSNKPAGNLRLVDGEDWTSEWIFAKYLAKALRKYLDIGVNFTEYQVQMKAQQLLKEDN